MILFIYFFVCVEDLMLGVYVMIIEWLCFQSICFEQLFSKLNLQMWLKLHP